MSESFSIRLRARRSRLGWTQEELAERAGVGVSSVSAWERGLNPPTGTSMAKLAEVLGVPVEHLDTGNFLRDEPSRGYGSPGAGTNPLEQFDDGELSAKARRLIAAGQYQSAKPFVDELARRGVNSDRATDLVNAAAEIAVESDVVEPSGGARGGAEKRRPVHQGKAK